MAVFATGASYNMHPPLVIFVSENYLLSDAALSDADEDQLGYEAFAVDLADIIQKEVPSKGFVVSVNGQWGSGKSTILNFLENELSEGDKTPTILRFNPWWFSGEADLIQCYLEELAATLGDGSQYNELRGELAKYAKAVSKIPFDAAGVPVNRAVGATASFIEPGETTTSELKSSIENTIRDEYDHIVVFIDEIDRLTNRETSQVFKLVKSVADFPNTSYVLAFSREIVTDALEADENPHRVENGGEFLDKIVQLPRRVPVPKQGSLRRMLEQGLHQIAPQDTTVKKDRNSNIITEICEVVDTPRDVTRLLNSVQSSYRVLDKEINFLDIVALEAIKEHAEPVYETVRREPESFAFLVKGPSTSGPTDEATQDENISLPVENLLSDIFPHWHKENFAMSDELEFQYRESNRVAHPDLLHRYLRKTVPQSQYSRAEISTIIRATDDKEKFTQKLRTESLNSDSEPTTNRVLLSELLASRDKIRDMNAVLRGIFNIADDLIRFDDRPQSMFGTNTTTYLLYLYRFTANESGSLPKDIKKAIRDGESLFFPWYVLNQEGAEGSNSHIRYYPYTLDQEAIIDIIRDLAAVKKRNKTLVDAPNIHRLMGLLDQDDDQFVLDWLEDVVTDETRLPRLLVGITRSSRINGQPVYYINPDVLREYVDLETVQTTVSSLTPGDYDEREKRALKNFQKVMELLEDGKNPGNLENWSPISKS
jgi:KaiC/GvpD/RAD55 family RecA-like ATPase